MFVPYLEKAVKRFKGRILYDEEMTQGLETKEGANAYQNAIQFLKAQRSLPPLAWHSDLVQAC